MTNPEITICPHSNPGGILSRAILLSLYAGHSQIADYNLKKQTTEAYHQFVNLMKNMGKIYQELSRTSDSEPYKTNKRLSRLHMWRKHKGYLLDATLLAAFINYERYLKKIRTTPEDSIFMCQVSRVMLKKNFVAVFPIEGCPAKPSFGITGTIEYNL